MTQQTLWPTEQNANAGVFVPGWVNLKSGIVHALPEGQPANPKVWDRSLCGVHRRRQVQRVTVEDISCGPCLAVIEAKRLGDTLALPPEFLPCVDDPDTLRVMADLLEERGSNQCELLRTTANEWETGFGCRFDEVAIGMDVWARYSSRGWSEAQVASITPTKILVRFTHRFSRQRSGHRAWWDLVPMTRSPKRPRPRPGYSLTTNVNLARALRSTPYAPAALDRS